MSLSQEVRAFGLSLGLTDWTLNSSGVAEVALGDDYIISVESLDDDAIVLATWRRPYMDASAMEYLLRGAWLHENTPLFDVMQVGVLHQGADTTVILARREAASRLNSTLMETWLAHFMGLFDAIDGHVA